LFYCGNPGHYAKECRKKAADKAKNVQVAAAATADGAGNAEAATGADGKKKGTVGMVERILEEDDEDSDGDFMCMPVTADPDVAEDVTERELFGTESISSSSEEEPVCAMTDYFMVDSGSDAHMCRRDFASNIMMEPPTVKVRDVQKQRIELDGSRKVPFVWQSESGNYEPAIARFSAGEHVGKHILSAGLLYDADYDVVISKRFGVYLGYEQKGTYKRIPMVRKQNTFGCEVVVARDKRPRAQHHGGIEFGLSRGRGGSRRCRPRSRTCGRGPTASSFGTRSGDGGGASASGFSGSSGRGSRARWSRRRSHWAECES